MQGRKRPNSDNSGVSGRGKHLPFENGYGTMKKAAEPARKKSGLSPVFRWGKDLSGNIYKEKPRENASEGQSGGTDHDGQKAEKTH